MILSLLAILLLLKRDKLLENIMIDFFIFLLGFFKVLAILFICVGVPLAGLAWLLLTIFVGDAKIDLTPIVKFLEKK